MIADKIASNRSRSEDDPQDQIGSQSATPSGIRTPRPDPSDKRLPGITHAYFGQVGAGSTTSQSDRSVISPAPEDELQETRLKAHSSATSEPLQRPPAVRGSAGIEGDGDENAPQPPTADKLAALSLEDASTCLNISGYPTPPVSSGSSFTQKEMGNATRSGSKERSPEECGADLPQQIRKHSASHILPLKSRRHTAGLNSLSGIVTKPSVPAAHISNPAVVRASTTPSTPTRDAVQSSALSSLSASYTDLVRLTDSAAQPPRQKSTPPQTPRALSGSGSGSGNDGVQRSTPSTSKSSNETVDTTPSLRAHQSERPDTDLAETPNIDPPKGKLLVKISEARGLKPSYDPYFVCVFEYNEYISKGPKPSEDPLGSNELKAAREEFLGGLPIKKSGSDMGGRPIAIPMKSRQSSTTSLNEQKLSKPGSQLTDPKWEHEATL